MKFVMITASDSNLFALGEDGFVYRQTWHDKPTAETTYNEYGGVETLMRRVYSWQQIPMPNEGASK